MESGKSVVVVCREMRWQICERNVACGEGTYAALVLLFLHRASIEFQLKNYRTGGIPSSNDFQLKRTGLVPKVNYGVITMTIGV